MHLPKLLVCSMLIVVVGVLVEASRQNYGYNNNNNSGSNNNNRYNSGHQQAPVAHHYHGNGGDYKRPSNRPNSSPYHSYTVRPTVYGGNRMYHYKGYARHYPMPPVHRNRPRYSRNQNQYAPARHNKRAPARHNKRHQRAPAKYNKRPAQYNNAPRYNTNNNYQAQSYKNAPATRHYQQQKPEHLPAGYTLKPIKALALVPIAHGSDYFNRMVHNTYNNNNNHNNAYQQHSGNKHPKQQGGGY